ncbi:penicillin-binding protein [Rhodococcus antarcticus]|uniref:Penicillin-binding protein n=1 Tax=Rhodococcus antarcticus TaxID=2987751 RepID=A0ABY6NZ90_9NOCA|nr:transglycosylase domain-containing protein [Rhodococcus antarcticus]UZJ24719.1 penicillin-binding protein [Rhodococcus antarcticus]
MTHQPPPGSRRAERAQQEGRSRRAPKTRKQARSRRTGQPLSPRQLQWRRARRTLYSLVALGIIGPIVAFMVAYVLVSVPNPADIKNDQVATVFYDDGSTALSTIVPPEGNRTNVTIDQIPLQLRYAVLAAEDRTFYTNPGFSVTGIGRAVLNNVTGGDTQGGSTITQQYVKNALTGNDQTITRKLKELVISTKMARQVSKDDILTAYLNTIYFGRGAYGVAAASQAYFGTSVDKLTVPQAAVLASSIRSPAAYDPATNPGPAQDRWGFVLDGMVGQGWISASDRAALTYPAVQPRTTADTGTATDGPEGLIVSQVKQELAANGITEDQLNKAGLQIVTTVNQQAQQSTVSAVQKTLADQPANLRPASVSVDPRTGAVRAYYGNSQGSGTDFAATWAIQPGSSFKVFALATALKQGVPLSKKFDGSSPQTIAGQKVANSDGENCGSCTLAQALVLSLNTVYYQLTDDVGAKNVVDTAHAAGIPATYVDAKGATVPSLVELPGGRATDGVALGQYGVPPLDMAAAYGTLANDGMQHAPYFVQKVTTSDGRVLLDRTATPNPGTPAIDPAVAQNVISAMEPIAKSSRNHQLAGGRQSAAKTGTAQLKDTGENANGWMIGCTPSLCTASVVTTTGLDGQASAKTSTGQIIYGSGLPSDIWKGTMDGALDGTPNETFPDAPPLNGDASGGQPSTRQAPRRTTEAPPAVTTSEAPAPAPTTTAPTTTAPTTTAPTTTAPTTTAPTTTAPPITTARPAPAPPVGAPPGGSLQPPPPQPAG